MNAKPLLQLRMTVEQELLRMMARRLDHGPSADELPFTVQVVTEDLMAKGLRDGDSDRVRSAFALLGPTLDRWPTVRQIMDALPSRKDAFTALPPPGRKPMPENVRQHFDAAKARATVKSILRPGESFGDYQAALYASGMKKAAFDAARLGEIDEEAAAERRAIQQEDHA